VPVSVRSDIGSLRLEDFDVVVLAGPSSIGSGPASRLRAFVEKGGGLLAFPSARGASNAGALVAAGVLPASYGARRTASVADAATLDGTTASHPALALFRRSEESDIGSARLTTTYALGAAAAGRADRAPRVAMRFADGRPAIIDAQLGRGRVVQCGFTAGSDGGDLPLKAAYVPRGHQLVSYLAGGRGDERMVLAGQAWQTRLGLGFARSALGVVGPDGRSTDMRGIVGTDDVSIATSPMLTAGVYRIRADGRSVDVVAVNSDPRESELRSVSESDLRRVTGVPTLAVVRNVENITEAVGAGRHGKELWRHLLVVAIALLGVEALVARIVGRRT